MKVDGSVTIGTNSNNTGEILVANGLIRCNGLKIKDWLLRQKAPDYVFSAGYQLPELKAVESFIKLNSHLPEVPSAATMGEEGIDLKEFNLVLLKKIEELTLYTIQQNKRIEALEKNQIGNASGK
jgi:hypothetical protein